MSLLTTIPKLEEMLPLVRSILLASPYWINVSEGIKKKNPGTDDKSVIVLNTGSEKETVERHLNDKGVCVEICPILHGRRRDQSDTETILDITIVVKLKINPARNANTDKGGAGIDAAKAIPIIINALCRADSIIGGERFKIDNDAFVLSSFDPGLLEYELMFTKESVSL